EELSLLPRLQVLVPALDPALQRMHAEHAGHGPQVLELCELLQAVANSPDDAKVRAQLAVVATNLQIEFADHLQAEETAIFPWIASALSAEAQAAVIHELRARRQPGHQGSDI
ncbi:MAG: hemerythrin domain-containing protein, partial [Kofleriaceae bacterium]|nr:hemerythrin domain-containing protein [Kofleriaceae bacterium]